MPPPHPRRVDQKLWQACAGATVKIPALHSRVYYFPRGQMEHASPSRNLSLPPLIRSLPFVPCYVSALDYLADPLSDEVFAKLLLTPLTHTHNQNDVVVSPRFLTPLSHLHSPNDDDNRNAVVSFSKILTPSDANNGGGFSVPRFCADSIFPPLNFDDDPPVQVLSVTDVHGVTWQFRHIYRGTPRRHLLTTGWSKFVNHKKLVAGDSVVFVKDSDGKVFVGIRRALRFAKGEVAEEEMPANEGFSRSARGRVSARAVAAVVEAAGRKVPFEVVYYPRTGLADFVVKAEIVEEAMKIMWVGGMRVKMGMETEDSSRMTWFQGTVSSASASENGPWRMLQVNWDEPEVLQNAKQVSPWQVELVSPVPTLHTAYPPAKRFRADQGSGLLSGREDREGDPFFPMTGSPNLTIGHLNKELLSYDTSPAGMQGARHDLFSASSFSNFLNDNSYPHMDNFSSGNNKLPRAGTVSTELNIGSPQSDDLSPHSQSSFHSIDTQVAGTHNGNSKVGSGSIQLFGLMSNVNDPPQSRHVICETSYADKKLYRHSRLVGKHETVNSCPCSGKSIFRLSFFVGLTAT
ncbi:auxin response factor 17-like isoform X2 [Abrus precatorius]|uniref:Auxin response factor n=1 Tax=Abrus precatorius TaxID=3816 RepID=A0A8B8JMJ6_ABRPR|nr:auxin response factor 17-like isoform X2 [Abrus precatorius]